MENKRIDEIKNVIRNQDIIGLANYVVNYRIPEPGMTEAKKIFRNKVLENRFLPTLLNLLTNTYLSDGEINSVPVDVYVDNFIKIFIDGESKNNNNEAIMRSWSEVVEKPVLGQPVENFAELHKWRLGQMNSKPTFEPPKPQPNDFMCDNCESKGDCDVDNEKVKFLGIVHRVSTDKSYKPKLKIKDGVVIKAWYKQLSSDIYVIIDQIEKNFYNLMTTSNKYKIVAKSSYLSEFGEIASGMIFSNEFDKQRFHENFEMFVNKLGLNTKLNDHLTLELVMVKEKQKRYLKK